MLEDSIRAYHEMLFDLSRETQAEIITLEPFIFPKDGKYENWVPWRKRCQRILENWRVITTQDLFRFKNLLIARLKDWDMMPSPQIVFI